MVVKRKQDPLVGLALNPGLPDIVLPSADELRALWPKWIRYLATHQFQDFQTGQNSELDLVLERYRDCDANILVLVNTETLNESLPPHGSPDWGDANSGYIGRASDLAQKIAAHYQGRIHAIQVYNETEGQGIAPEDYGALLAAAYAKIKAVNALPVISTGLCCGWSLDYLQRLVESAGGAFDGIGWFPYANRVDGYPTPDWGIGEMRESLTRARAIGGKPLWLTEIGADLGYVWPTGVPAEQAVAEYLKRAYKLFRELGEDTVAHAFWFTWRIPNEGWGLVDDAGNHRAAWYAFQFEARLPEPPAITSVVFTPTTLDVGGLVNVSITVENYLRESVTTQGPDPGLVYDEGDTFYTRGFPDVAGAYRVGIDFDGRVGVDHPYRWGLGAPLASGESRTITGAIRLARVQASEYWAGVVQEQVAWVRDREGVQRVTVTQPRLVSVTMMLASSGADPLLNVFITLKNDSSETMETQGPDPGFVYDEGDTFYSRGFPDVAGAFRVGIDFDGRSGVDHPYRWGLGAPLAPGQTVTIAGAIRLTRAQTTNYWAGLVRERIAWLQDREGVQRVTLKTPAGNAPQIIGVTFTPTALDVGQVLNVNLIVKNNSNETLATQEPEPGFIYGEGDTFYTRGFPDVRDAFRVGVDFDGRGGIDHPYRWGLGAPLAPGQTAFVAGAIRLRRFHTLNYWAGLVREQIAWLQDREGVQLVRIRQPRIISVELSPTALRVGQLLNVRITVLNDTGAPLPTQGPDPDFVYEEGDTFYTRGFPDVSAAYRVGIDFDGRAGIDHPYRWGLGATLMPGQTTTIVGAIRLNTTQARDFWAGLVCERVAWLQDREGSQLITVIGV